MSSRNAGFVVKPRRERARGFVARPPRPAFGFVLLEILVTTVVVAVGLLGLAGLQARSITLQLESYQRTQALLLAQDMADRLVANKRNAPAYLGIDYGTGAAPDCAAAAGAVRDRCEWDAALRGASERLGVASVGTLTGGRGCVEALDASRYRVVVAWQGFAATVPPASDCGRGRYGAEARRRVVVVPVQLPDLAA